MVKLLLILAFAGVSFAGLVVGTAETSGMDPFCAN
jgi:hypothetical protein